MLRQDVDLADDLRQFAVAGPVEREGDLALAALFVLNPGFYLDVADDPAFIPGSKVAGRDVIRTRTVYDGGKVLHQDTFFSHYAPVWGGPAR